MHAQIDAPGQQRHVYFLGEDPLAADIGQGRVLGLAAVATGGEHFDLDAVLRNPVREAQELPHQFGLGQRQRTATRSDPGEGEG